MHVARTSILHARRIRCGRSTAGTGAPGSVRVGRVGAPGTGCGRFLRRLEEESYAFLIRPRRFGKSLWVSVLENYYDRTRADEWHAVFDGTDIGRQPTEDRSRYVILRFNFSAFDDTLETLRERFEAYCEMVIRRALERNVDLFPDAAVRRILAPPATEGRLGELFTYAGDRGIPLYGLIDEYDNFANTVLAHHGREAYESFTHGGGFYRNFFATLKAGAGESGGGLERLFITGVSPITMDDVTSGFNSGTNVSLSPRFNDLLGFTENEVRNLLELYRERGAFVRPAAQHRRRGRRRRRRQSRFPAGGARRAGELPVAAVLLRPAEHPRRVPRQNPARYPQPDRAAAAVRLPARRLPRRRGLRGQPRMTTVRTPRAGSPPTRPHWAPRAARP